MQDTLTNNRMIAEFMGWKDVKHLTMSPDASTKFSNEYLRFDGPEGESLSYYYDDIESHINYHKDWSLLMPVVEKIESIKNEEGNPKYTVIIEGNECIVRRNDNRRTICRCGKDSKLEAVYRAITQFLTWLNQNK